MYQSLFYVRTRRRRRRELIMVFFRHHMSSKKGGRRRRKTGIIKQTAPTKRATRREGGRVRLLTYEHPVSRLLRRGGQSRKVISNLVIFHPLPPRRLFFSPSEKKLIWRGCKTLPLPPPPPLPLYCRRRRRNNSFMPLACLSY